MACALLSIILAAPPSARKVLERVFWKGVSERSPAGSHMRVVPEGLRISTRVVKSKVRQPAEAGLSANRRVTFGRARPADTTPAERRKSRRCIASPLASFLFAAFEPVNKVHFLPRACNPSIAGDSDSQPRPL